MILFVAINDDPFVAHSEFVDEVEEDGIHGGEILKGCPAGVVDGLLDIVLVLEVDFSLIGGEGSANLVILSLDKMHVPTLPGGTPEL